MNKRRMDPGLRVVTGTPLTELWDEAGPVPARRGVSLTTEDLRRRLREGFVRFVVAEPGAPLRWLPAGECHDLWKTRLKDRIVDTEEFCLEDFPDAQCYVAFLWHLDAGDDVVLLETYH